MNFSKLLPNLQIGFSIAFKLISKLASCAVAATGIAGVGFVLTIPYAEEIAVVVIVEKKVRVTRVLLLPAVTATVA